MPITQVSEFLKEEDCESFSYLGDPKFNKYLAGYTKKTGNQRFDTKKEAYKAMMEDPEATGIVKSSGKSKKSKNYNKWTVRKGKTLITPLDDYTPEISFLKINS